MLQILSAINLDELEKYFGNDFGIIKLDLRASAKIMNDQAESGQGWVSTKSAFVTLERVPYKEAVPLWIIVVSSLVGSFFLLLIIFVLIKVSNDAK